MAMVFSMAAEIERGLISARTKEVLRVRQASGLPVGRSNRPGKDRGAARQQVHPEVHRKALQILACQPCKLDEEARN